MPTAIHIKDLVFSWPDSNAVLLDIPEFEIELGDHVFIEGFSGSGKSTFLELLTGIQTADSGEINILGNTISSLKSNQRDLIRSSHFGIIFQTFNLLPFLTVRENVKMALSFSSEKKNRIKNQGKSIKEEVTRLLQSLQIEEKLWGLKSSTLSIGQQQRVAVARAFIGSPEIIIADEPTSALDKDATNQFMNLLFKEAESNGSTILFVSHDTYLKSFFMNSKSILDFKRE